MTIRTHSLPALWRAALISIVIVAILALIVPAAAANATSPGYVTAVWFAKGTNQWPVEGQTLLASKKTSGSPLDVAFVKEQAETLGCGYTIQGDGYANDKVTAKLLEGGKLYGPSNPQESWPGGTYKSEYSTVFYTGDCPPVVPEQPADKVTTESHEAVDCTTDQAVTTYTTTTVTTKLVDNVWVEQAPTVEVTTSTRDLTSAELADCHPVVVPPKPEDKVEYSTWEDDLTSCASDGVTQHRTRTETTSELVDNVWVAVVATTSESQTRPKTDDENTACAPIEPPVVCDAGEEVSNGVCMPADLPDPAFQPKPHSLATTGVDLTWAPWTAGGLALLGTLLLLAKRRKPRLADDSIDDHSDILPRH